MFPTYNIRDFVIFEKHWDIKRGDTVTFRYPRNEKLLFLKRVIGLPGETVAVKEGRVFVNGLPLVEPYITDKMNYDYPEHIIDANAYFLLGDNRNYSDDSHVWGFVQHDKILGKAIAVVLPLSRFRVIDSINVVTDITYKSLAKISWKSNN